MPLPGIAEMGLHANKLPSFEPKSKREAYIARTLGHKYQFIERLGEGGSTATVYAVVNKSLDRIEALKVLPDDLMRDKEFLDRFKVEAKICASFSHPNIVTIYDYERLDKFYFFSMLFVDGPTLTKFTKPPNTMPIHRICRNMATICDAIHYAHQQGVIHRDIKASNVMLDQSGKPYITDFGIAKWERSLTRTQTGVLMGSPYYMSPEQIEGHDLDCRSDIYSLGVTLYVLLTQRYPFQGETAMSILAKRLSRPATPPETYNPDLPPRLIAILTKTLEPDRRDRYQTAAELADEINDFLQCETDAAAPEAPDSPPVIERIPPAMRFARKKWLMAVVAMLAIAITFPLLLTSKEDVPAPVPLQKKANERPIIQTEKPLAGPLPPEKAPPSDGAYESALRLADVIEENEMQSRVTQTQKVISALLVDAAAEFAAGRFEECIRIGEQGLSKINQIPSEEQQQFDDVRIELRTYIDHATVQVKKNDEDSRKTRENKKRLELLDELNRLLGSLKNQWTQKDYKGCLKSANSALKNIARQPAEQQPTYSDIKNEIVRYKTKAKEKLSRQKRYQELNRLAAIVEGHFRNDQYAQCIAAASTAQTTFNSLPANEKRGYAKLEEKVKRYKMQAEKAKKKRARQIAALDIIDKKIAHSNLKEAMSLIDALLIQSNLDADMEKALQSRRKTIVRVLK